MVIHGSSEAFTKLRQTMRAAIAMNERDTVGTLWISELQVRCNLKFVCNLRLHSVLLFAPDAHLPNVAKMGGSNCSHSSQAPNSCVCRTSLSTMGPMDVSQHKRVRDDMTDFSNHTYHRMLVVLKPQKQMQMRCLESLIAH